MRKCVTKPCHGSEQEEYARNHPFFEVFNFFRLRKAPTRSEYKFELSLGLGFGFRVGVKSTRLILLAFIVIRRILYVYECRAQQRTCLLVAI